MQTRRNVQPSNGLLNDIQRAKEATNKLHDGMNEQKEKVNNVSEIRPVNFAHIDKQLQS